MVGQDGLSRRLRALRPWGSDRKWPVAGVGAIWTERALISAISAHRSPMRERTGSLAVPSFEAAERLTVPDPLQSIDVAQS